MYSEDDVENPMLDGLPFDDNEFRNAVDELAYSWEYAEEINELFTLEEWLEMLQELEGEDELPF